MEKVTVSSKGQIAIPKAVREALNLSEGTKLNLEVRGHDIVLSKEPVWMQLEGCAAGEPDLVELFAKHRREEREREDSRI
jgi:AbrB family looped-hinge helix DNA binding protein